MTKPKATPHDDTTDEIKAGRNGSNGGPPDITLELQAPEVELLYQMLQNGQFGSAIAKQIAASLQSKVEQVVSESNA